METQATVYIVDDDPAVRKGINFLAKSVGLQSVEFESARDYLNKTNSDDAGCLILDLRMPEMGGLDLQEELNKRDYILPVIILTGHGDVPASVKAFKAGAFDFIEKPPRDQVLLDTIQKAIRHDAKNRQEHDYDAEIKQKLHNLKEKDRKILKMIGQGLPNKTIAFNLDLSEKTIEYHRAKMMKKLDVHSLQELMKFAIECGINKNP
jgi:two-component system response regulator FixJ